MNKLFLLLLAPMALVAMEQPNRPKLNPPTLKTLAAIALPKLSEEQLESLPQELKEFRESWQKHDPFLRKYPNFNLWNEKKYQLLLAYAAADGYAPIIPMLLKKGAEINSDWAAINDIFTYKTDSAPATALMEAARNGKPHCVQLLLKNGAEVDQKNGTGITALMCAACNGNTDCIELLLKAGAKIDTKDRNGHTALMRAIARGTINCVVFLLKKGANKKIEDLSGNNALSIAQNCKSTACIELLTQPSLKILAALALPKLSGAQFQLLPLELQELVAAIKKK